MASWQSRRRLTSWPGGRWFPGRPVAEHLAWRGPPGARRQALDSGCASRPKLQKEGLTLTRELGIGIVDTTASASWDLAVKGLERRNGWYVLCDKLEITP